MATATPNRQNAKIYRKIEEGETVRKLDGGFERDTPTHSKVYINFAKGRGYVVSFSNVAIRVENGFRVETFLLDMSGKNSVLMVQAARFNAKTLQTICDRVNSCGPSLFVDWNEKGMDEVIHKHLGPKLYDLNVAKVA
jgi:hypothetical protein